jgi:hypothetical protein
VVSNTDMAAFFVENGGTVNVSGARFTLNFAAACSGSTFQINPLTAELSLMSTAGRTIQMSNSTVDGAGFVRLRSGSLAVNNLVKIRNIIAEGTSSITGGGTLELTGGMSVGPNATLDGGGTLQVDANATLQYAGTQQNPPANMTLQNSGSIDFTIPSGKVAVFATKFVNKGVANVTKLALDATGGTVDFQLGVDQTAGSLNMLGGGLRSEKTVSIGQGSRLTGTGSISTQDLVNAGTIAVGRTDNPEGSLQILGLPGVDGSGNFAQTNTGTLTRGICDRPLTNRFNRLIISGKASLGGTLNVNLVDNPPLAVNDTFEIISYGSLDPAKKQFATTNVNGMAVFYGNTGVKVKKMK